MWPMGVNFSKHIEEMPSTSTLQLKESNQETQKMDVSYMLRENAMTQTPMGILGYSSNEQIQEKVVSSADFNHLADSQTSFQKVRSEKTTTPIDKLSQMSPPKKHKKAPVKRAPTSLPNQKRRYTKRTQKIEENKIQDFVDNCRNKEMLLHVLLKAMDPETSHTQHKDKKNDFIETKSSKNSSTLANANRVLSDEKLSLLQETEINYVINICNIHGDAFREIIINELIANSNASRVLELFKIEEIKEVLCEKYSDFELYDFLVADKVPIEKKILETAPDNVIIHLVESRDDLKRSQPLLDLLIRNSAQNVPEELNANPDDNLTVKIELLVSPIANLVQSREDFRNDSSLLNVVLQNGPKDLSDENMENLKVLLQNKVSPQGFLNLSHEVSTFHMKEKDHVFLQLPQKTEQNIPFVEID